MHILSPVTDSYSILFYPITLEGRRGTTDEFAIIPFHLDLFSAALVELAKSIPVHSLILSSHLFFCLPLFSSPEPKAPGELIGWEGSVVRLSVRPSVRPQFQMTSPLKLLGRLQLNSYTASRAFRKEKLFKWSGSHDQHGGHAHIW